MCVIIRDVQRHEGLTRAEKERFLINGSGLDIFGSSKTRVKFHHTTVCMIIIDASGA